MTADVESTLSLSTSSEFDRLSFLEVARGVN